MQENNFLKVNNGNVEIKIIEENGVNMSPPELAAEAILALIGSLDTKFFSERGIPEKFDIYIEEILEKIHGVCEWAGWTDKSQF